MKRVTLAIMLVCLILAVPVFATDISDAEYLTKILVTNNTTSTVTDAAIALTCNTSAMVDGEMLNDDADDLVMQDDRGEDIAVMPGLGSNPWIFYTENISPGSQQWKFLYTRGVESEYLAYFPNSDGMLINDSPTLELTNVWEISLRLFVDTTQVGGIIFDKPNAITCNITAAQEITVGVYSGGGLKYSVTASGVEKGEHVIIVLSDGFDIYLYVDGVLKDTDELISL